MVTAQSNGREIVFNLRLVADPRNGATARSFGDTLAGSAVFPGGAGGAGGPRPSSAPRDAEKKEAEERMKAREREIKAEQDRNRERKQTEAEYSRLVKAEYDRQDREAKRVADSKAREAK